MKTLNFFQWGKLSPWILFSSSLVLLGQDSDMMKDAVAAPEAVKQEVSSETVKTKETTKEVAITGANAAQIEKVRREEALVSAQLLIKQAEAAMAEGNYSEALGLYKSAQKKLSVAPASTKEINQIYQGAFVSLNHLAEDAYAKKDYVLAKTLSEEALQLNPENPATIALYQKSAYEVDRMEQIKKTEDQAAAEIPKEVSNSEFAAKQKRILELYRAAENYFKSEQFDQAEVALKDILQIDKYSATAYHRLREVQLAKYKKLTAAKQQTETQTILEVQEGWKLPLKRDRSAPVTQTDETELGSPSGKTGILKKLNSIVIKKVEFENTPILSAINYLIKESRDADPSHEGVNIIPAFDKDHTASATPPPAAPPGPEASAAPGVPAAPGDASASAPGFEPAGGGAPAPSGIVVNLNLHDMPLLKVIRYVTTVANLKYRVEPDAVVIVSSEIGDQQTQTRYFNVAPGVFRSAIESKDSGGAARGGGGAGGFVGFSGDKFSTKGPDVKKMFEDFGITFPAGTSISYNDAAGVLVARHTNEMLDQIEQILLRLNKTLPQVQIEAKFIDVKQTDLDELGFRWAFAPTTQQEFTVESGQGTALPGIPIGGPYRGLGNPLTGGNRNAGSLTASALDALIAGGANLIAPGAGTLMTVTGVLTNPQVQVMIDALAQKGLTNLLSAPRVTTTSGEEAKILVTREFIYPSTFTDPQVSTGSSTVGGGSGAAAVIGPTPSGFTTREVGVILGVRPTVGNDNYTIDLNLEPEVVDFEGFINYTSQAQVGGGTPITFTIPQPLFNKRRIQTHVIIWDGQTVLLGGLIREDITKVNDKVPFLGDIPLVGRLFQSKVESSVKRNLIVFLSARIVDPAGNPVNKMQEVKYEAAPSVIQ